MTWRGDVYRAAAEEHITSLGDLYKSRRYVLAHYVAGLAVECMLRAYRCRWDSTFHERHDLRELARQGRFLDVVPSQRASAIGAALGEVVTRWENQHRFRSGDALRDFLLGRAFDRRIKGDFVKESARRIINAAIELVTLGAMQWKRSKRG